MSRHKPILPLLNPQSPPDIPAADLEILRSWPTLGPLDAGTADVERLAGALARVPLPEDLEPLLAIALADPTASDETVGRAALRIARSLPRRRNTLETRRLIAGAWLWLAAWHGCPAAALCLIDALFSEARWIEQADDGSEDRAGRAAAARANAGDWFVREIHPHLDDDRSRGFASRIVADLAWRPAPPGPARVVIAQWATGETDSALDPYRALTKPVPLGGGDRDAGAVVGQLRAEFPWMDSAIERIADDLALCFLNPDPWIRIRPLLLVGPPGSGKSRFARRLAELVGIGHRVIGAAGSSDNRDLEGTAHGWSNHEPGAVLRLMLSCGVANPLVVVDEIDKAGGSEKNGDIRQTLLAMIEPETARRWYDECLQVHADLSTVSWIMTANDLAPISRPLRSRLAVAEVGLPGTAAVDAILEVMRRDLAAEIGVDVDRLPPLDPAARRALVNALGDGRSLRHIKAALGRALAATARRQWPGA